MILLLTFFGSSSMKSRDENFMRIKKVCSLFKKISDGAHGNTSGFHGSLTPHSMWKVFQAMDVFGRSFADLGAGNGILLSAALANGASKAHGFELPENKANRYIFEAATARMTKVFSSRARAHLEFKNIEKVEAVELSLKYSSNSLFLWKTKFSVLNRYRRCHVEPSASFPSGMGCTLIAKFMFCTFVPSALLWTDL